MSLVSRLMWCRTCMYFFTLFASYCCSVRGYKIHIQMIHFFHLCLHFKLECLLSLSFFASYVDVRYKAGSQAAKEEKARQARLHGDLNGVRKAAAASASRGRRGPGRKRSFKRKSQEFEHQHHSYNVSRRNNQQQHQPQHQRRTLSPTSNDSVVLPSVLPTKL